MSEEEYNNFDVIEDIDLGVEGVQLEEFSSVKLESEMHIGKTKSVLKGRKQVLRRK